MKRSLLLLAAVGALLGCRKHAPKPKAKPLRVSAIAVAEGRTCAIVEGRVRCAGLMDYDLSTQWQKGAVPTPVEVPGSDDAIDVGVGETFACLLRRDRTVRCFGAEHRGQLGRGVRNEVTNVATEVPGVRDAVQIAVGAAHACARLANGTLTCWGSGAAAIDDVSDRRALPVSDLRDVVDVTASGWFTCAITANGTVHCFVHDRLERPEPVRVGFPVLAAAMHGHGGCVIARDRRVACRGRLAELSGSREGGFHFLPGIADARRIALRTDTEGCVVDGKGDVSCFAVLPPEQPGGKERFQLPSKLEGPRDVFAIAAASDHFCTASRSGEVWCWGRAENGQLGDGTDTTAAAVAAPRRVPFPEGAQIVLGGYRVCGVSNGRALCFMPRPSDDPRFEAIPRTPTPEPDVASVVKLARARSHRCFVDDKKVLRCGGVGGPALGFSAKPPLVSTYGVALVGARDVVVGDQDTCAFTVDGSVKCFGASVVPALLGKKDAVEKATDVPALRGARALVLASRHGCAILETGVACFGHGFNGQLGDGKVHGEPTRPVRVAAPGVSFVQLAAADGHTCARTDNGEVYCWGYRFRGRSGPEGSGQFDLAPAKVDGLSDVVSLAVGRNHACAARKDGALLCWGANDTGQCAAPITGTLERPRITPGVQGAVEVFAGEQSTCARLAAGEVVCFGDERPRLGVMGFHQPMVNRAPIKIDAW